MGRFTIGRSDGRSNQQVVIDLVKANDTPGALFSYEALQAALNEGSSRTFRLADAQIVIRQAMRRLRRELQRTLMNVRGVGYRLAFAKEHKGLALSYEAKGNRQIKAALSVLQNVRLDEMDENNRLAHQGTWMLMSAVYSQQTALMRRQRAVEESLKSLTEKVGGLGAQG